MSTNDQFSTEDKIESILKSTDIYLEYFMKIVTDGREVDPHYLMNTIRSTMEIGRGNHGEITQARRQFVNMVHHIFNIQLSTSKKRFLTQKIIIAVGMAKEEKRAVVLDRIKTRSLDEADTEAELGQDEESKVEENLNVNNDTDVYSMTTCVSCGDESRHNDTVCRKNRLERLKQKKIRDSSGPRFDKSDGENA